MSEDLAFYGLFPTLGGRLLGEPIQKTILDLYRAMDSITWLGPRRIGPSRSGVSRGTIQELGLDGAGAQTQVLADSHMRKHVSNWYFEHTKQRVEEETLGRDLHRLVLVQDGGPSIPFSDTGEGLQQIFSAIVAVEQLRENGGLLIIEEPESHLHPRLQAAFAKQISEVLAAQPRAQVLIETHSEMLLTSALHAAIEKEIKVRISWVAKDKEGRSELREVPLDKNLRPKDSTLERAFESMGVMRRKLIEARRRS